MVKTKKKAGPAKKSTQAEEPVAQEEATKSQPESDGDSSSSEEGPEWTADDEKAFLKTLGALKSKTESIYDSKKNFWNEEGTSSSAKPTKKEKAKPMYLKDYERKLVLEKDGQIDDSEEDDDDVDATQQPGYYEEQDAIKKQLKAAIEGIEDDDGETLFKKREKTVEDKSKEESDYYDWIKNKKKGVQVEKEIESLKEVWENPQLEEDDKFLRDYLLNKDYETDGKFETPTYDEIIDDDDDEEQMEREREYERKYNFRFEEPDQEFIKQYPRSVSESLRREDKKTKRKEKRLTKKEEKVKEKKEKIKALKKKQGATKHMIEEKLRRLKEVTGEDIPINLDDLKGDFDPAEYDRRMQELFNDKYYGEDVNYEADEQKPVFSDMEDFDEDGFEREPEEKTEKKVSKKKAAKKEDVDEEDSNIKQEAAEQSEDEDDYESEIRGPRRKESKRKQKRRKLMEESKKKKPLFDPSEKTFEEYFDEYYAMDFEDLIDDQPTRFRYRSVVPNDFGLTADEILNADERNLNSWASVKKAISYRSDDQELFEVQAYKKKARNAQMKQRILGDLYKRDDVELDAEEAGETGEEVETEKKKKKKKGKKSGENHADAGNDQEYAGENDVAHEYTEETDVAQEYPEDSEQTESVNNEANAEKTARRRKKKSAQPNGKLPAQENHQNEEQQPARQNPQKRKKHDGGAPDKFIKKSKKSASNTNAAPVVSDERLRAYGINPKKFNAKMKYKPRKTEGESAPV